MSPTQSAETNRLKAQIKQQQERIARLEQLVRATREQMQAIHQMDLDDLRARYADCQVARQQQAQALEQVTRLLAQFQADE